MSSPLGTCRSNPDPHCAGAIRGPVERWSVMARHVDEAEQRREGTRSVSPPSNRACPVDGMPMLRQALPQPGRHWVCPACQLWWA